MGDLATMTSHLKFLIGQQRHGLCLKKLYFSSAEIRIHSFTGRESWCVEVSIQTESSSSTESGVTSCAFPANLRRASAANAALSGNKLISFGEAVDETQLEAPWETVTLIGENYTGNNRYGVECFGNDIFVVGDSNVERYDAVRNELKLLPSLPYSVINMATVAYKDNIIILGGQDNSSSSWQPLDDVLMYSIHTLDCVRLPSMLEKRSLRGCDHG